jgi:peptidoglycan/xylan/chitin deacetylase (PgdA/CDA1 family)
MTVEAKSPQLLHKPASSAAWLMTETAAKPTLPRRAALTQPVRKAIGELFFLWPRLQRFPILAYHSIADVSGQDVETVAPAEFERQLAWLAGRFEVMTVSELVRVMAQSPTKRHIVAITFDDGYRDGLLISLPMLQRHGFRATFYIPTAYIGGLSAWNPVDYIGHRPVLTAPDIRTLSDAGQEIGSHGHNHVDLTSVGDVLLDEELARSQGILADIIRKPVVAFAPPHGRSNGIVAERARRLGYSHLVKGGRFTANPKEASPFDLQRITIARGDSLREFTKKVSGAYQWLKFRER